ncbi:Uncharacterized protein PCOAH_00009830 [Plasmodium coatneyi]|uniref:Pv-fam-d protein n=1 Tax=Plasmodium coatneyi TaxID=208452 RepID=A0A1B1DUA8_9APIC|nr:Uncharacterized protein PCOAH_00009830 [Plasmodium coatneyi]ANQ06324.1 Uncharacterized protein PCOAH_00009830 [Plasmodium coatneyi]
MFLFGKTIPIFHFLIWILHYHDKSTAFGTPCSVDSCINVSSNETCDRMLTVKEKEPNWREQNYVHLQKRIKTLLDEDDELLRKRLNALAQDDHFRKQFNALMRDDLFKKRCNKLMLDKKFQKHFNILNSNNDLQKNPFLISPDVDHSNQNHSDPFKFCNNLEEFFDELQSKNYHKEKIIDELQRHEECKAKQKDDMKRTNNLKREPNNEVRDYVPSKLEEDGIFEGSIDRYVYKELVKPRKRSTVRTFLRKVNKMLDAEVNRFLKKKAAGRYAYNGRGIRGKIFSFIDKYRVFMPVLLFLLTIFLVIPIFIFGIFVFPTAILTLFSLAGNFIAYMPLIIPAVVIITTDFGESQDRIVNPRTILNCRNGRLLRGDIDIDLEVKYDLFKDKITDIVDEDDYAFENRVKSVMQDDKFRECFNKIRCNGSSHRSDNLNDSYENVLSYDQFYDSCQWSHYNLDQLYDSCESIDSSYKSSNKNNYDDEDEELDSSYNSVVHSGVPQYNAMKYEMPITGMRRNRKKSIFSRIFKFLKKQDEQYEKYIYDILNSHIPPKVRNRFREYISPESIKLVKVLTIFSPAIAFAPFMVLFGIFYVLGPSSIMSPFINIFIASFITSTCYKEDNSNNPYNIFDINASVESGLSEEQNYAALKEKVTNLLDEDDAIFGERLNALAQDDEFREHLSDFIDKDASEKMFLGSTQEKGFQKYFDSCNSSSNYEGNTNRFSIYDSSENFPHELERKNNCKAGPVNGVKRNKSNIQESVKKGEEEYDIAINLSQDLHRPESLQSLIYENEYKRERQSRLERKINKLNSKLDSEIIRFLRIRSGRIRIYKGKGLSGYFKFLCSKYRVFKPIAIGVGLSLLMMFIAPFLWLPMSIIFSLITVSSTLLMGLYYAIRTIDVKYLCYDVKQLKKDI